MHWACLWICLGVCLSPCYSVPGEENLNPLCRRQPPDTVAPKTSGDNGFRIKIAGRPPPQRYTPGQVYTVSINGTYPSQLMLGFMLVAVPVNAEDESTQLGDFQHLHHGATMSADECPHVITHRFSHPRAGIDILWTAPPAGAGCVEFRATIMEYEDIWYKDEGALTKVFCEEVSHVESSTSSEMIPDCCACGTGKYQMTFEGLWSRQTHPKDWPSYKRLLHWSNVVGASHSKDYMIWEYGGYASQGIKKVCEFGFSTTLEEEMRLHSTDVRTVVKTPGIYWSDAVGLRQSRWARFSVDRKNHLLTMLTMMGPSPDWCVGVSALDLCLPNCSWAGDMVIDLYPWDAGTDDGQTYMSRNQKSEPQQRITEIVSEAAPASSPFSYTEPLKPLARLTLHRIHPKPGVENSCTENSTLDDDLDSDELFEFDEADGLTEMERKKQMMMAQAGEKCAVSDWLDWSECSVTCGSGERLRKRMFTHPMGSEDMCGLNMMETESCMGAEQLCESIDDACAMTGWSDWSPCSVTCGKGVRERRRYYLRQMDALKCTRQEDERDMCIGAEMDCMKVVEMKNFTAICSLTMDVGPCRGFFMRWYYDVTMQKCLKFPYGGCRGNNNRFRTLEECTEMCLHHMMAVEGITPTEEPSGKKKPKGSRNKDGSNSGPEPDTDDGMTAEERQLKKEMRQQQRRKERLMAQAALENESSESFQGDLQAEPINCMVTEWSQWSECSATCGSSTKSRQRMVKREAANGGRRCPMKLEKTKRCRVPKCPVDCVLGPWSDWSPCGKSCGDDSIQERSRQVVSHPRRGGQPCDPRLERRFCMLPQCPNTSKRSTSSEQYRRLLHGN